MPKKGFSKSTNTFVNPYNFIPINTDTDSTKEFEESKEGLLSGRIDCLMHTKTPVIVPDTSDGKEDSGCKDHKKYGFFSVDDKFIIPGSSIRGVVRSVYEALTDSCMTGARSAEKLSARREKARDPGLLVKNSQGEFVLFKAKRYMLLTSPKEGKGRGSYFNNQTYYKYDRKNGILAGEYRMGQEVSFSAVVDENGEELKYTKERNGKTFEIGTLVEKIGEGELTGYLFLGEDFSTKHHDSIFVNTGEKVECSFLKQSIDNFERTIKLYNDEKVNTNLNTDEEKKSKHYGYPGYKNFRQMEVVPVWFDIRQKGEERIVRLSPAQIGRSVLYSSLKSLVGKKAPCESRNKKLCKACSLFGMVGATSKDKGLGSRVRFSDAEFISGNIIKEITLDELSTPKPSFMPFYSNGGKDADYDFEGITIAGRKFYWNFYPSIGDKKPKTNRNATFDAVDKGTFKFSVFYDGISEEQLKELIWVLNLGVNDENDTKCLKIGHGKPLGFGSVKVTIDGVINRQSSLEGVWHLKYEKPDFKESSSVFENLAKEALLKISDLSVTQGWNVSYPSIDDAENHRNDNNYASHQWFGNFKQDHKENSTKSPLLPSILDSSLKLKTYMRSGNNGGWNQGSSRRPRVVGKYENGQEYEGVVKGMNNSGNFYQITMSNGAVESIWKGNNKLNPGDKVKIRFTGTHTGKDGKEYNNFTLVKKL